MDDDFRELTPVTLRLIDIQVQELTECNRTMEIDQYPSQVSPVPFVITIMSVTDSKMKFASKNISSEVGALTTVVGTIQFIWMGFLFRLKTAWRMSLFRGRTLE